MKKIRIGQIALSFHRASAAYITYLMNKQKYEVEIKEASHEAAFKMLANNEIDMLVSAWLPGSHGKYLQPILNQTVKLGVIYEPYCIWGLPDYSNDQILTVADLKNNKIAHNVERTIYSINPGAGISRFSVEIMQKYDLEANGFKLYNLSEDDFFSYVETSIAERREFVIPFWHPQSLHYQFAFRELEEPFSLLRSKDQATIVVSRDFYQTIDPDTIRILHSVYLGNSRVSALDYFLHKKQLNIKDALQASGIDA